MAELAWVTGAYGFVGRHGARALAARGAHVIGIGHGFGSDAQMAFSGATRAGDPTHYQADVSDALAWGWAPQRNRVAETNACVDWFRGGAP